jgi:hypothetical protein
MDHERIDFSALDPSRDELRWTRSVDALVTRVLADRSKRHSVEQQLLRWARPVLAVAAGLCIVAWTAGYFSPSIKGTSTAHRSAAITLASWAANNQIPEPSDLLVVLETNP